MSDSRLEKFIYAICSMDVTDLPVPLSRIEKLWNCLITGETPDFEPLSRNEKYLMAMLDRYDISNLPAPMSRGEKLLYKIAVGETDLSDVPGYLSRYEELLKYLIENGGISGGDFEYVLHTFNQSLYTLYTTAEKPVKSAILKGQTLVNVALTQYMTPSYNASINGETITLDLSRQWSLVEFSKDNTLLIPNEVYTCILYDVVGDTTNINFSIQNASSTKLYLKDVGYKFKFTMGVGNDLTNRLCYIENLVATSGTVSFRLVLLKGDYTNVDIPYFEGMQSVKMPVLKATGKNLLTELVVGDINSSSGNFVGGTSWKSTDFINVDNMNNIVFHSSIPFNKANFVFFTYDKNKNYLGYKAVYNSFDTASISLENNIKYVRFRVPLDVPTGANLQLEQGTTPTTYEPHKSNILTVNEDIELRGIGDVRDELDLLTGEVIENTYKYTLTGDESISLMSSSNTNTTFQIEVPNIKLIARSDIGVLSDNFPSVSFVDNALDMEKIFRWDTSLKRIGLTIKNTKASTVEELRVWLSTNETNLVYLCDRNAIKTVDLTVVDQNKQPTKLGTFENITHVSLKSAGLIPEVEMEVATNLLEDTVFNLTNAFNTLYPTASKPVVDGTLYGQTLVNLSCLKDINMQQKQTVKISTETVKKGTVYTFKFFVSKNNDAQRIRIRFYNGASLGVLSDYNIVDGLNNLKVTTKTEEECIYFSISNLSSEINIQDFIILEGDYTNQDIPYFEGMQSVKMPVLTTTGKNLFDINNVIQQEGVVVKGNSILITENRDYPDNIIYTFENAPTESVLSFDLSSNNVQNPGAALGSIWYEDGTKIWITAERTRYKNTKKITDIKIHNWCRGTHIFSNIQLEQGSATTTYKPYQTNILTVNEEVELRGIGNVQDTLDLMTGEKVERVGEIVLDGSSDEDWYVSPGGSDTHTRFIMRRGSNLKPIKNVNNKGFLCDKFKCVTSISGTNSVEMCLMETFDNFFVSIIIDNTKLNSVDVDGFKLWLQSNPVKINYVIETESIKTVDLTVVNQDGNETKLRTFDETTHVLLDSEGLIPTASLTVRTKIPSASSTSLLMDELSTEQQQLETTVDEQSDNVDATMIATTEIYEENL